MSIRRNKIVSVVSGLKCYNCISCTDNGSEETCATGNDVCQKTVISDIITRYSTSLTQNNFGVPKPRKLSKLNFLEPNLTIV